MNECYRWTNGKRDRSACQLGDTPQCYVTGRVGRCSPAALRRDGLPRRVFRLQPFYSRTLYLAYPRGMQAHGRPTRTRSPDLRTSR